LRRLTYLVALSCAATAIALPSSAAAATTAAPTSLDFGSLPVGTQSATQAVTLTQSCTLDPVSCVAIPSIFSPVISATTGFTQTNSCPPILVALIVPQACTIDVSLVPNAVGQITGLLSTGSGGPAVTLSGVGTSPPSSGTTTTSKGKKCKKKHKRSASSAKKKKCKKRK